MNSIYFRSVHHELTSPRYHFAEVKSAARTALLLGLHFASLNAWDYTGMEPSMVLDL